MALADTFNRTDSAVSLGTASDGGTWTVQGGTWGISSNKAYMPATTGGATVDGYYLVRRDFGSNTQDVTVTITSSASGEKPIILGWDPAASGHTMYEVSPAPGGNLLVVRRSAGSDSILRNAITTASWTTATWRVTLSSGVLTVYKDGVQAYTTTDGSPLTAGTWVGFGVTGTGQATFDDFIAADPVVVVAKRQPARVVSRAVMRAAVV